MADSLIARYLLALLRDIRERYADSLSADDRREVDETIATAEAELSRSRGRPRGSTAVDVVTARKLIRRGYSQADAAKAIGVSRQRLHAALKAMANHGASPATDSADRP